MNSPKLEENETISDQIDYADMVKDSINQIILSSQDKVFKLHMLTKLNLKGNDSVDKLDQKIKNLINNLKVVNQNKLKIDKKAVYNSNDFEYLDIKTENENRSDFEQLDVTDRFKIEDLPEEENFNHLKPTENDFDLNQLDLVDFKHSFNNDFDLI